MLNLTRAWSVQVMGDGLLIVMSLKEVKMGSKKCPSAWVCPDMCWVRPRFPMFSRKVIKLGSVVIQVNV